MAATALDAARAGKSAVGFSSSSAPSCLINRGCALRTDQGEAESGARTSRSSCSRHCHRRRRTHAAPADPGTADIYLVIPFRYGGFTKRGIVPWHGCELECIAGCRALRQRAARGTSPMPAIHTPRAGGRPSCWRDFNDERMRTAPSSTARSVHRLDHKGGAARQSRQLKRPPRAAVADGARGRQDPDPPRRAQDGASALTTSRNLERLRGEAQTGEDRLLKDVELGASDAAVDDLLRRFNSAAGHAPEGAMTRHHCI